MHTDSRAHQPSSGHAPQSPPVSRTNRRAPDPEFVQMYRQGIPAPKIAAATGLAASTVRYHLHLAAREEPGLRDQLCVIDYL